MTDRNASGSSAESAPEPPSSQSSTRGDERGSGESWLDRLWAAVGLRPSSAREDLQYALEEEEVDPAFSPEERLMLQNILSLRETRVEDIMVPRANINAVDVDATLAELIAEFQESGHSRMPVYRDSLDDPIGMIHIKDLMGYFARTASLTPPPAADGEAPAPSYDLARIELAQRIGETDLVRKVLFVPPSMPVATLLATMQSSRTQMALVIDEYGGTDGIVSIEDAVETVVGEIEDEYDDEEPMLVDEGAGIFIADAQTQLDEVAERVSPALALGETGEDVETIGGMVFRLLGRIPTAGETVAAPGGFSFEILDADQRRVKKLRILPPKPAGEAADGQAPEAAGA
jgi:CBS domain containing-hemolysin-like protein